MQKTVYCPKCGTELFGAYGVLGHIITEHNIVDASEIETDE